MTRRALLTLGCLLSASGQRTGLAQGGVFPWLKRGDPKIDTRVFQRGPGVPLAGARIGIFRFGVPEQRLPAPPAFETFLQQVLFEPGTAAAVEILSELPWERLPYQPDDPLSASERIQMAAREGSVHGYDLVVLGGVDRLFRTSGEGLIAKVHLRLIATDGASVLWYGRKRADWLRFFPTDDCLLHLAWSFVSEW